MIIHVIGVPMDLGSGRRGVDMGPSAIRIAGVEERLRDLGHKVIDEGNLAVKTQEEQKVKDRRAKYLPEIKRVVELLARKVEKIVQRGNFPLVLGGDHSVAVGTISGVAAHARKERKKVGVLWIDAHADFNTPESSPSGNVHGMPLAACIGLGPRQLRSVNGAFRKVDPHNVAIIGLRNVDRGERDNLKKFGLNIVTMEDVDKFGIHHAMEQVFRQLVKTVDYIHVSFDLDSVDPVYAPGVGTPVKGGLDYREAHLIMEMVADSNMMSSLEIVEVNPILDTRNQSAEFAVELVGSAFGKKIL